MSTTPICAHGSLSRQCRVCELEQENAELRVQLDAATKHADELAHVLSGETTVESFVAKNGCFDLTIGNTGAAMLAQAMIELFETGGATNFLTFKAVTPKGDYSFTIQKATGITPSEKYAEICDDRDRLRAALAQVEWDVAEQCFWCMGFKEDGHHPSCVRQAALGVGTGDGE